MAEPCFSMKSANCRLICRSNSCAPFRKAKLIPIGAKRPVKVDVRLVSATNKNLMDQVKAGAFREDLFYRLSVLPMHVPPLRERTADIEPLVFHFVKKITREENTTSISAVRPEVLRILREYHWPGNIRELENTIFRAIVLCETDELTLDEFPQIASQMPDFELPENMGALEHAPPMQTPENPELLDIDRPGNANRIAGTKTGECSCKQLRHAGT